VPPLGYILYSQKQAQELARSTDINIQKGRPKTVLYSPPVLYMTRIPAAVQCPSTFGKTNDPTPPTPIYRPKSKE